MTNWMTPLAKSLGSMRYAPQRLQMRHAECRYMGTLSPTMSERQVVKYSVWLGIFLTSYNTVRQLAITEQKAS